MAFLYYKIVRKEGNVFKTLQHGIKKNKILPVNTWIKAEEKDVIDGSKGTVYKSGIHILDSKEVAESYINNFKNKKDLVIVPVYAQGLRRKTHSRHRVFLASSIYIVLL